MVNELCNLDQEPWRYMQFKTDTHWDNYVSVFQKYSKDCLSIWYDPLWP